MMINDKCEILTILVYGFINESKKLTALKDLSAFLFNPNLRI